MNVNYSINAKVRYDTDVFIAGGGPAGTAAAMAAAGAGASVYLAEEQNCFGGAGTAGLVPAFMQFGNGVDFLAGGIGRKLLSRLGSEGGNDPSRSISIKVEVLKRVYDELMSECGANFTFHTKLIGTVVDGGSITHAVLAAKSGIFAAKAKVFIDCTGDGDLSAMSGAEYMKGNEEGVMMAGTMCSLWAGIDWSKVVKPDSRKLEEAFNDKVFTIEDRHLPGMWRTGETTGGGNIGHTFGVDGTDEVSLTKALIEGRRQLEEYEKYYREYLAGGYAGMELVSTGAILGIRETRRITGDYILNIEDFHKRAVFEDEIGRYSYPVDIHAGRSDAASYNKFADEHRNLRYAKGESYGIPYRSLLVKGFSNLLSAGRCISTDRYMQSSVRVMPGCYITGQAAGIAAALAARAVKAGGTLGSAETAAGADVRKVPVREIQKGLAAIGAYLPNFLG